ncbi:PIN domain-containing protein [Glycomyces sp. YM15]|uniref:type II toxin-antitoxin system VapC family toxin n=1 Tax=Glycomyces sp. YM15 TaxID=2800446 RepID=UPI00196519BE|nr:PIN domain-containing protein [Glycomyces sp. YM15]
MLDSSVLLGHLDAEDALHHASSGALEQRAKAEFVIPASVFAEVMVGARKLGDRTAKRLEETIDDLVTEIYPIDREVAWATAGIRARRKEIRLPDALVLATGEVLDAEVLTADKRWRNEPGHVTVIEA